MLNVCEVLILTRKMTGLEGDHLAGVRFGILGFAVGLVFHRRGRRSDHRLWEQCCVFGTRHILPINMFRWWEDVVLKLFMYTAILHTVQTFISLCQAFSCMLFFLHWHYCCVFIVSLREKCAEWFHFLSYLVAEGFELTGGAGIQIHELVSVHQQSRLLSFILVFEGHETPSLHLQDTRQVSNVAFKGQEARPDFPVTPNSHVNTRNMILFTLHLTLG